MNVTPGDLVLARNKGLYAFLIRAAETLRWREGRRWNHAAIVSSVSRGHIRVIAMGWHCEELALEDLGVETKVVSAPKGVDVRKAVAYAQTKVGTKYGVLTIVSILINLLTPRFVRIDFRSGKDSLICSALVARAWEHGGLDIDPVDPFQVTPAELAEMFDGE
jgi:hypothetical protein